MINVSEIQRLQAKVGSANWNDWQLVRQPQYDYARLPAAGTNSLNFFVNPAGSTDPVSTLQKTQEDTNLVKTGSFGQVYFIIQQIRVHALLVAKARQSGAIASTTTNLWDGAYAGVAPGLLNLLRSGVLRIFIGQKEYFTLTDPFITCPPGFGVQVDNIATAVAAGTPNLRVAQDNTERNVWAVTPTQMVEPDQTIQARIDFPDYNSPAWSSYQINSVTPAVNVGLILDGYVCRPAQ
jgi:hypothetical protein